MVIRIRKQIRLKKWNYTDSGWYYVTICSQNRKMIFGGIFNNRMFLNCHGDIINKFWINIQNKFNNVELNEFQIMPNHIHGIIVIRNTKPLVGAKFISPETYGNLKGDLKIAPTTRTTKTSLSVIIKWFKSISTINIRKSVHNFQWQKSFYDHIIRNEFDLNRIRQYIRDNPRNWENDRNNYLSKSQKKLLS